MFKEVKVMTEEENAKLNIPPYGTPVMVWNNGQPRSEAVKRFSCGVAAKPHGKIICYLNDECGSQWDNWEPLFKTVSTLLFQHDKG